MRNTLLLAAMLWTTLLSAQSWEIGLSANAANYQGDVVLTDFFTPKETNAAFGLFVRRNMSEHWALRANAYRGTLSGDDANFPERKDRGYKFETPITEVSLMLEYNLLSRENKAGKLRPIRPYIFGGAGFAATDPATEYNETEQSPGVMALIARDKLELKKGTLAFPVGGGFKFPLGQRATLALEGGLRPTLGDYLDGISQAGNPDKSDWYIFGGLHLSFNLGKAKDSDHDGISDKKDKCPELAGIAVNMGCPSDRDADGVYDADDKCPDLSGVVANMGCPSDRDKDNVYDADDKCPDLAGIAANMGCPADSDKDGVYDADDRCPNLAGIATNAGCPADRDGDGVYDLDDRCPDVAGVTANKGCPADRDGDGIYDKDDKCPDLKGLAANAGCPSDRDADGVYDSDDRCPDAAGLKSNNGCPEMKAEDKKVLDLAVQNINFETNSDKITKGSFKTLDQVAEILNRYNYYSVAIEGHTDNVGNDASNLALSQNRARACYDYLVKKGVQASRVSHEGYGESRPIVSNDNAKGRRQNRRVAFVLSVK